MDVKIQARNEQLLSGVKQVLLKYGFSVHQHEASVRLEKQVSEVF